MSEILVEARGLTKLYRSNGSEVHALRGVDIQVVKGEFLAIMGKSGSGKSTLLHLLAGLDRPTAGDALFKSEILSNKSEKELALFRRTNVGFVYQFFNLVDSMTCLDNVILPVLLTGVKGAEAKQRALALFEGLSIAGKENKVPGSLSGGQRQRVAIARALINQPPLLFADEPTGSLDTQSGEEVLGLLGDLHRQGLTIVMVTHDARVASRADRVLFMQDGRMVDEATFSTGPDPKQLLSRVLQVNL